MPKVFVAKQSFPVTVAVPVVLSLVPPQAVSSEAIIAAAKALPVNLRSKLGVIMSSLPEKMKDQFRIISG
jgi:hypothetical protein